MLDVEETSSNRAYHEADDESARDRRSREAHVGCRRVRLLRHHCEQGYQSWRKAPVLGRTRVMRRFRWQLLLGTKKFKVPKVRDSFATS